MSVIGKIKKIPKVPSSDRDVSFPLSILLRHNALETSENTATPVDRNSLMVFKNADIFAAMTSGQKEVKPTMFLDLIGARLSE